MRRCYVITPAFALASLIISGCGGGAGSSLSTTSQPTANPVPSISSLTPASVNVGAAQTSIAVAGSGFVNGSAIQWNGVAVATSYTSTTQISALVPASDLTAAGTAQVSVQNPAPGGGTSAAVIFTVKNPVPVLTAVNPKSVLAESGDLTLDLTGSGFVSSSTVDWNGASLQTTFVGGTELNAVLPATSVAASGANTVTVQNPGPGGGTSSPATFDVESPVPAISNISPTVVPTGAAATIAVTGSGFEANSVLQWNGSTRPTTVLSPTLLQVALSAADLQKDTVGALTVQNSGPGGTTSHSVPLVVTSQPIPAITGVTVNSVTPSAGGCPQLQVVVHGKNFAPNSTIQANGVSLPTFLSSGDLSALTAVLSPGFVTKPGALWFTVTNPGQAPIVSNSFPYASSNPDILAICATPSPTTIYAGSNFSVSVQPSEINSAGNATVSVGALPAGLTTSTSQVLLSPSGGVLHFQAATTTATGNYTVVLNAVDGPATASTSLDLTLDTGTAPSFGFTQPSSTEIEAPIGGSGTIQFGTVANSNSSVDYDITPSLSGLPSGTTAAFSPSVFSPGQNVSVTISAAANAPITQNATITLTGTPKAPVAAASTSFFLDVAPPPGSLSDNRTDFTPTAGTPFAAVYDPSHELIFASNPGWNRVDVISNQTHKIIKSIPVLAPRGLDITQDNSHVWVGTGSQWIYKIDTATLGAIRYLLPAQPAIVDCEPARYSGDKLLALADGTLFLFYSTNNIVNAAIWNPQSNSLNQLTLGFNSYWGIPARSQDGTHVYASGTNFLVYDTGSKSVNTLGSGAGPSYGSVVAVNRDGSRLALEFGTNLRMYDGSLNLLGTIPGVLPGLAPLNLLTGGAVFSQDGTKLFVVGNQNGNDQNPVAVDLTVDVASLQVLGTAPTATTAPAQASGTVGYDTPFAVDNQGMVIGIQDYGIIYEDAGFYQDYAANQPGTNVISAYGGTFAGPLAGGTTSSLYLFPELTPDVWFGQSRGAATISQGQLAFTSPPSTTPGPVNIKFIYPDGTQLFYPQLFSYSTFPEYAVFSGSAPEGGAPAQVIGYGLPQDSSGGTLTVGGNAGTITTIAGQYPPYSPEPYPSTVLNYTFPAGSPGWADLQIQTPIGTGTLPKSVYYARSVTDYPSSDTFAAVLLDPNRNQLYLSAGDHIDVFSTTSNQYVSTLHPAAQGATKLFTGLALTPDGSRLLAANLLDGSLAVINPDVPSSTYAIPIAPVDTTSFYNCTVGPLYVAPTSGNQAFVATGGLGCITEGILYIADLQARTATRPSPSSNPCGIGLRNPPFTDARSVDSSGDGNYVAIGGSDYSSPCIYSVQGASYTKEPFPNYSNPFDANALYVGISISSDANIVGSSINLADVNGNVFGNPGQPVPLYGNGSNTPTYPLMQPKLNASGGLYYFAYPSYFEIIDVPHGTLRMRFSLTEAVQNVASPIAIDAGGRFVYLLTDKGLTVVDLGAAPLSIGHLSLSTASPGTQVTLRGSGFDSSTQATVGGQAASVTVTDQNTMTLTIPVLASGPADIVLTRANGESYTLENGIVIQ